MWADRVRASLLLLLVMAQAALGWTVRQQPGFLAYHLLFGIALLLPAALHIGLRAAFDDPGRLRRAGLVAASLAVTQLLVGGLAFLVPHRLQAGRFTGVLDLGLVWLHWAVGAALLISSVVLVATTLRVDDSSAASERSTRVT